MRSDREADAGCDDHPSDDRRLRPKPQKHHVLVEEWQSD
jgi:hypothetical protein